MRSASDAARSGEQTEALCEPLQPEDFVLQAMPDASPTKWHLAHTSWFFETFGLAALCEPYRPIREDANFLFNSYYNAVGGRIARDRRGMLSRPSIAEILDYRREVDRRMAEALGEASEESLRRISPIVEIGLNHEQQHQELILTDLKIAFGQNPMRPVIEGARFRSRRRAAVPGCDGSSEREPGLVRKIGHRGIVDSPSITRRLVIASSWNRSRSPRDLLGDQRRVPLAFIGRWRLSRAARVLALGRMGQEDGRGLVVAHVLGEA